MFPVFGSPLYLVLKAGSFLKAGDPAVPDAVCDGWKDDSFALVGFDCEPEVSGQIPFLDPSNESEINYSVQKSLKIKINVF